MKYEVQKRIRINNRKRKKAEEQRRRFAVEAKMILIAKTAAVPGKLICRSGFSRERTHHQNIGPKDPPTSKTPNE